MIRSLLAEDIFISYARKDSSTYATGLADELTKRGYACFIDRLGTESNHSLPHSLRRKLRNCALLVVVVTKWSGTRESIQSEVVEFKKTRRTIVPVVLDDSLSAAIWYDDIAGIAPEHEANTEALNDGIPSEAVINRITKSYDYRRRSERLRAWAIGAATALVIFSVTAVVAWYVARTQLQTAREATIRASEARTEADRQQGIAIARRAATNAYTLRGEALRTDDWADMVRQSTLLSLEATKRLTQFGVEPADAQQPLRAALDILPRSGVRLELEHDVNAAWLTADGEHLITREDDGFLRVRGRGNTSTHRSLKVGTEVAFDRNLRVGVTGLGAGVIVFCIPELTPIRTLQTSKVSRLRLNQDGTSLLAATSAGSLAVWDIASGKRLTSIKTTGEIVDAAISPDDRILAVSIVRKTSTATSNDIQFWSIARTASSLTATVQLPLPAREVNKRDEALSLLTFSNDGSLLAGSTMFHGAVINPETKAVVRIEGPSRDPTQAVGNNVERITYIGFSDDGKSVGTIGDDATVQTWNSRTGELMVGHHVQQVHGGGASSGPYFTVTTRDGGTRIVDVRTGRDSVRVLRRDSASSFAYAPDGSQLVFYDEGLAWWYDLGNPQQSAHLIGREDLVPDVSDDGRFVALDYGDVITAWDLKTMREVARLQLGAQKHGNIRFSATGKYLAAATLDNVVHVWETSTGQERLRIDVPISIGTEEDGEWNISQRWFSPSETFFALETKQPHGTRVWDIGSATLAITAASSAEFTSDDRYLVSDDASHIRIIDTRSRHTVRQIAKNDQDLLFALSPDNTSITLTRGTTVELSRLDGSGSAFRHSTSTEYPRVAFSRDGGLLAVAYGKEKQDVRADVIATATGKSVSSLRLRPDFDDVQFSPSGAFVQTFTWTKEERLRGEVEIWDAATGRRVVSCRGVRDWLNVAFSPDETKVAIVDATAMAVRIFNLSTGQQESRLPQDRDVTAHEFSPDGRWLVVTLDEDVRVWETGRWHELARLTHPAKVKRIYFAGADILTSLAAGLDGYARAQTWPIGVARQLITRACEAVGRNLRTDEWSYTFGTEPIQETCPSPSVIPRDKR
jgi:WD40 repeat protein